MPISDEALQSEKNSFIAVTGDATVGQAVAALQAEGGEPWWHLVVRMDDGSWGITRFSDLFKALEKMATASEVRLGGRKGLTTAVAIERDSMETRAAQAVARKSPGRLAVVTVNGIPFGILVEGVMRSAAGVVSAANLNNLGGKSINLKDYGRILLSSSKTRPAGSSPQSTAG